MKVFWVAVVFFISLISIHADELTDPNLVLSSQQQEEITELFTILLAVYDNDLTLIPDEPNEIIALKTSEESRDQLAWEIFRLIRRAADPNLAALDENNIFVMDRQSIEPVLSNSSTELPEAPAAESYASAAAAQVSAQSAESVEELSNPLGSRILESKTYRITTLPLEIEGHVVIPAGAKLIAPYDPNTNIIEVMPGGLLDMGKVSNCSDPNYLAVLPPVEIVSEDPNGYFNHNDIGIRIDRGANPNTRIENVVITACRVGIAVREQLVCPLRNVVTCGCYDGIHLYAPGRVIDCEFWYNGTIYEQLYSYSGVGMYVHLDSAQYPYPEISIDRTVFCDADAGMYIEGCNPDPNLVDPNQVVPKIEVVNSCFMVNSFAGIHKDDTAVNIDVSYCAFAENMQHGTFNLSLTECIELDNVPFYLRTGDWRLYTVPGAATVDKGYGMAEDGTGTCDSMPDFGQMNIGCHFPVGVTGSFGIPSSPSDFNWDGIVDELDLDIMDWCMGAIGDPNIVKFDTNYDSQINMPDFGLMSFDYGYSNDANLPGNHDPNSERSDFNDDHKVDLEDVGNLADYWLTKVFDEYRTCGLCNLYRNADPNEPQIDGIIDSRDSNAFMADWGKQFFSDPNIIIVQSASKLTVAVGTPEPAWKISAFLDDELIGQYTAGELGSSAFDVDLTRYGPGSHKLKIVRNIGSGLEITERIISDPNSTGLFFAGMPDTFEPNEPFLIQGFNLNEGELNFKVGNVQGETVYDVNVPSGPVSLSVPASVFGQSVMAALSVVKTPITPETEARYEKILGQKFDREKYRGKWIRFLILLPDRKTTTTYKDAIYAALAAIEKRVPNYPYIVLVDTNVNHENIKFSLYNTLGPKIVIYFGHANSHVNAEWINGDLVGGVQRTIFQCYEKNEGYVWDTYNDVGVVSYTRNTNPEAESLPKDMDNTAIDFTRLLQGSSSYHFVPIDQMYIFGCRSARYPDMAVAQGCFGAHDNAYHDMLYCGFTKDVTQNNANWYLVPEMRAMLTCVVQGLTIFFNELGDGKTIPQAVSVIESQGTDIRQALFGADGNFNNTQGILDRSSEDDDILTFYGYGYIRGIRLGLWGQ